MKYDVIVVGARVAGASTAMHLARKGYHVIIIERADYLGEAFSSHQMDIVGSDCLFSWGVYDRLLSTGCPGISENEISIGDTSFVSAVPAMGEIDQLHYCKRSKLDNMLLDCAVEAGAEVQFGSHFLAIAETNDASVSIVVRSAHSEEKQTIQARFLVGADGMNSAVANSIRSGKYDCTTEHAMSLYVYLEGLSTNRLYTHLRNSTSAALFPTNDGQSCLFIGHQALGGDRRFVSGADHLEFALTDFPELRHQIEGASIASPIYRFPGREGFFREAGKGRCGLVGDASYFRDPIVGEGISDAMLMSELLAMQVDRVLRGEDAEASMKVYQTVRDSHLKPSCMRARKALEFSSDYSKLNSLLRGRKDASIRLEKAFNLLSLTRTVQSKTRAHLFRRLEELVPGSIKNLESSRMRSPSGS